MSLSEASSRYRQDDVCCWQTPHHYLGRCSPLLAEQQHLTVFEAERHWPWGSVDTVRFATPSRRVASELVRSWNRDGYRYALLH